MQTNNFLEFFRFSGISVFEAAILAYKQKIGILEMPPIQFLIYKMIVSFVQNSKSLQHVAQFLHVSAGLLVLLGVLKP